MLHSIRYISVFLAFALSTSVYALELPPNDGFVTDAAGILTTEQDAELENILSTYRTETSNEIAILILNSLEGEVAADLAVEVGREWGVGSAANDNGIMIVMSYEDREIFIATGYGLEGAVPDIIAKSIVEKDFIPYFRDGDYFGGFSAGIDSLKKHIGGEYTAERYQQSEGSSIPWGFVAFLIFILVDFLVAFLGRTKSWWLGGIFGVFAGVILMMIFGWWLSIPLLTLIGLLIDYIMSRNHKVHKKRWNRRRRRGWYGGGKSGGGFSGFSGGSFGGGGAGGRW